ncbi:hypothetical protein PVAG01_05546 [Phlyctema vagabunda]|uniref:Uncharacterized protein n=1 Tax=Phlyctema vagabunda TaxID=108571 RepID=A0ABR4PKC3_9HELO
MANTWLPVGRNNETGWKLDIVSLLAVIGESSMEEHAQAVTASWTCILPRIIPAPQALLKPTRPARMPQYNAVVVGVHNGTQVDTLNYFPNIIHSIEDLPAYSFKVYEITHDTSDSKGPKLPPGDLNGVPLAERDNFQLPSRRSTFTERFYGRSKDKRRKPHVPAANFSPLNILSVLSFLLTIGLVIWAVFEKDGTALLALGFLSMVSSVVGLASWWQPALMDRKASVLVPAGDVVIRTREGAFIVVKCDENVARELYTGTEECDYYIKSRTRYRTLVGLGTFLLMVGVVLLGNCNWAMQAAIGSSYVILNGAYWLTSLIPKKNFWDLSAYICKDITPKDAEDAHRDKMNDDTVGGRFGRASFTRTLWYTIRETGKIGWVTRAGAAPATPQWENWLKEAESNVINKRRGWHAVTRKDEIVGETDATQQNQAARVGRDTAEQHAPATGIPPPSTK